MGLGERGVVVSRSSVVRRVGGEIWGFIGWKFVPTRIFSAYFENSFRRRVVKVPIRVSRIVWGSLSGGCLAVVCGWCVWGPHEVPHIHDTRKHAGEAKRECKRVLVDQMGRFDEATCVVRRVGEAVEAGRVGEKWRKVGL